MKLRVTFIFLFLVYVYIHYYLHFIIYNHYVYSWNKDIYFKKIKILD